MQQFKMFIVGQVLKLLLISSRCQIQLDMTHIWGICYSAHSKTCL